MIQISEGNECLQVYLQDIFLDVDIDRVGRRSIVRVPCATTKGQDSKWAGKASIYQKWPQMPIKGQQWPSLGQIPNFSRGSKRFGTRISGKPPRHLGCNFLVEHDSKWARKVNIWPKMTKNAKCGCFCMHCLVTLKEKWMFAKGG